MNSRRAVGSNPSGVIRERLKMSRNVLLKSLIFSIAVSSAAAVADESTGLPKLPPAPGANPSQPKADPAKVAARAAKLVDLVGAALHSGDAQAALENFLDAKSLLDR